MQLAERYNGAAATWRDMLESHGFPAAYRRLVAAKPHPRATRLIDIGAGTGALSRAYLECNLNPLHHSLLDPSQAMLTEARRTLGASVTCTQAVLEDFHPEQGYDVTLCAHVIEHCRSPAEAMRHLARITQPGGLIFLAVSRPHICQALIWFKWRHRWFSPETVTRMAQDAGLQNLETLSFERGVPARVSQGYVLRKPKGTDHADCTR